MGVTMEYGHPLTTWVVEHVELPIGKMNMFEVDYFLFNYFSRTIISFGL